MQNASNQMWGESLAKARLTQLISRHGPDFVTFFLFISSTLTFFNVFCTFYLLQTGAFLAGPKHVFYDSVNKKTLFLSI